MATFKYRAVDEHGDSVKGEMDAPTAHQVTVRLQERGLTVNDVVEMDAALGIVRRSQQLTWNELSLVTEQLRTIVRGGLPLAPALRALSADFRRPRLKAVMAEVQHDLEQGASLEEAIAQRHEAFPPLMAYVIRAGESTGNLAAILELLSQYSARMIRVRERMKVTLAYPAVVALVAMGVLYFMLVKIIPMFATIFEDFGGRLPFPTRMWIEISDAFVAHGPYIVAGIGLSILMLLVAPAYLRRTEKGRILLDRVKHRLPGLGQMHYLASMGRFSHTLSLLLASGVPILESLRLAAAASGSAVLQKRIDEASVKVAGGETLSDALGDTHFIGHDFCWLVAMGEQNGELVETLSTAAENFDRQLETRDGVMFSLLGPIVVVLVGVVIASIVVSLYLPIFTLGDQISGV